MKNLNLKRSPKFYHLRLLFYRIIFILISFIPRNILLPIGKPKDTLGTDMLVLIDIILIISLYVILYPRGKIIFKRFSEHFSIFFNLFFIQAFEII